jgi:hypothetical protein
MLPLLLTLKNNWRLLSIALLLLIIGLQFCQHKSDLAIISQRDKDLAICNASVQVQNNAIQQLRAEGLAEKERQELRDKEAAKRFDEANQSVSAIFKANIPNDCEGAIKAGLKARKLGFKWHNNIP